MRYNSLFLALLISLSVSAVTRTSVADGNIINPATWDCGCIPTLVDDIVINHIVTSNTIDTLSSVTINSGGSLLTASNTLWVFEDLTIMSGGQLTQNSRLEVRGNYSLFGAHSGTGELVFRTNGTLYGNGTCTKTGLIRFINDIHVIDASADLDLSSSSLFFKNDASIDNYGLIRASSMKSIGSTTFWRNHTGSALYIGNTTNTNIKLQAHYPDNEVIYNQMDSGDQIIVPANTSFYNLTLLGGSAAAVKKFTKNVVVLNNITMENCTVDPKEGIYVRNFTVGGDWTEINAVFLRRTSLVNFSSGTHALFSTDAFLSFHNITFEGTSVLNKSLQSLGQLQLLGVLDMNGKTIQVAGNWYSSGSLIYNEEQVIFRGGVNAQVTGYTEFGNVTISKSGASQVNVTGSMLIYGSLILNNGTLNSNGNVVIASNATKTGRLGVVGLGSLTGDLVVERYVNFASSDWHLLGSSVTGMSVGDWAGDFITTGFPGSDYPSSSFNSISSYNEATSGHRDEGFVNVASSTEAIAQGEGRRVYLAGGPNQISVAGPPITGPFIWNLSYTDTGDTVNDGWNLISNPYPSSIDWDDEASWNKVNVKDAIYVWGGEDGLYTSYVAGIGTNGGTQFIPSSQAFWVQTDDIIPTMSITENAKTIVDQAFKSKASQFFKLSMTTSNGKSDEVAVRAHPSASAAFDSDLDAYEFKSADQSYPSIALRASNNVDLSIYSLSELYESTSIPMPIYLGASGSVDFAILGGEGFPAEQILLYDSVEDEYHSLITGKKFTLSLAQGDYPDRFFLVLNPNAGEQVSDVKSINETPTGFKAWSNENQIFLDLRADKNIVGNLIIVNSLGQVLYSESSVSLSGLKSIDATDLHGLLIIQLVDLENGETHIQRLVR